MKQGIETQLRILVLDDEIDGASGTIGDCLEEYISGTLPQLESLEGVESQPIVLENLVDHPVRVTFTCNRPHEESAAEVGEKIEASAYFGLFDLVLVDDHWKKGGGDFAGQEILLDKVYQNIHGPTEELPLVCLFTQHWDDDRLQHFFKLVHEKRLNWDRIIPCNKGDKLQLLHVLYRALTTKKIALERIDAEKRAAENKASLQVLGDSPKEFPGIVGSSRPMRTLFNLLQRVADLNTTVLVLGETGSGKELVARAVHQHSSRNQGPFVDINCANFTKNLLDSELFGHEKGAFTGANSRHHGHFERAHGGTIFLDEVGDLDYELQAKLLRVLEQRKVRRVGGTTWISVDVRVVAATNQKLEGLIAENRFRKDLYYRLNVFPVKIPPLRNRIEDIPDLVKHFLLKKNNKTYEMPNPKIAENALNILTEYSWPGNVRELENCIERALILCKGEQIEKEHLPGCVSDPVDTPSFDGDGNSIFQNCIFKGVIRNNSDDKRYKLLHKMLHPLGSVLSDDDLKLIGFEGKPGALKQACSALRKAMKEKGIGWTIANGKQSVVPATEDML